MTTFISFSLVEKKNKNNVNEVINMGAFIVYNRPKLF